MKHYYRSLEQLMNNISVKQLPLKNTVQASQRPNKATYDCNKTVARMLQKFIFE